ncbi:unnamed protein product [Amoebophrya sp. A120]|nr:unnamed protein product [Amoebophrya sp. A120]|eukprot:GSA120T00011268001.1
MVPQGSGFFSFPILCAGGPEASLHRSAYKDRRACATGSRARWSFGSPV